MPADGHRNIFTYVQSGICATGTDGTTIIFQCQEIPSEDVIVKFKIATNTK